MFLPVADTPAAVLFANSLVECCFQQKISNNYDIFAQFSQTFKQCCVKYVVELFHQRPHLKPSVNNPSLFYSCYRH